MSTGEWTAVNVLTWRCRPLFLFGFARSAVEARFGPPHHLDRDSNGVGRFDEWMLGFPCGLEVALWIFQDPALRYNAEVHANQRDAAHILFHLGRSQAELSWWLPECPPVAPGFVLIRLDDNGGRFEMARYTSRCEAEATTRSYEARGHKQTYWVEAASG